MFFITKFFTFGITFWKGFSYKWSNEKILYINFGFLIFDIKF